MASVFRSFLEKLSGSTVGTFIGENGDLFYDPDATTPTIKISDGVTPGGKDITSASGGVQAEIADPGSGGGTEKVKCSNDTIGFETQGTAKWVIDTNGNIIPTTDNAHDIGSAEFKVRDMYVSENSLWVGDNHKVDVEGGKMKFRKRKKDGVPKTILDHEVTKTLAEHTTAAKGHSGKGSLDAITTGEWIAYARSLEGSTVSATIGDIWKNNSVANRDDYEEITEPGSQQGHEKVVPISGGAVIEMDLMLSNVAIIKAPAELFGLNINGAAVNEVAEGATFEATIHIDQVAVIGALNLNAITVNGDPLVSTQVTEGNTPVHVVNKLSTYKIYGVYIGSWKVTVVGYPE